MAGMQHVPMWKNARARDVNVLDRQKRVGLLKFETECVYVLNSCEWGVEQTLGKRWGTWGSSDREAVYDNRVCISIFILLFIQN